MLTKQAWKLLQSPNSLMARILKLKYYPKTSFLETEWSSSPSFVWRSIMKTQTIIWNWSRWCMGNGEIINICTDPWLPCNANLFIESIMPNPLHSGSLFHPSLILMSGDGSLTSLLISLMKGIGTWSSASPSPLLSTQINRFGLLKKKGNFSIKSCYKKLTHIQSSPSPDFALTSMWSLQIPP